MNRLAIINLASDVNLHIDSRMRRVVHAIQSTDWAPEILFSGTSVDHRINDFAEAMNGGFNAIWAATGGTTAVQTINRIGHELHPDTPILPILGTSDLTHQAWLLRANSRPFIYSFDLINSFSYFDEPETQILKALRVAMQPEVSRVRLLEELELPSDLRIVGGHLFITTYMLGRLSYRLPGSALFLEHHSETEGRQESIYWIDALVSMFEAGNTPSAVILGHSSIPWGSSLEIVEYFRYRLEPLGIPVRTVDHYSIPIAFA